VVVAAVGLAAVAAIALYATRDRGASTTSPPVALKPDSAAVSTDTTPVAAPVTTAAVTPAAMPVAARVSLQLTRTSLRVGDSARATVRAFDSTGTRMANLPIALSSSAPRIVRVDSLGRMVAIATGRATITARNGSVGASETVTVDERLLPLSAAGASDALKPLLVFASDERWDELQNIMQRDVLEAFKSKRGIDASLSGEPRVTSGAESATVDFDVTMRWVNFARLGRSGVAPLRATFVRSGQSWHITEIVARDKLP
jgi:hypothetical protein